MEPKKTFCRYYNLETENWEEVENLDGELEKRLLQEKNIRAMENHTVEEIANAIEGNGDTDLVVYDSGEFDVLYSRRWIIKKPVKGKTRWFREDIQPSLGLYGVELVVKATPQDIIDLQTYLGETDLDVIEARGVERAIFDYKHENHSTDGVETYFYRLRRLVEKEFPGVAFDHSLYPKTSSIELSFSGDLQKVCKLRKYILQTKYDRIGGIENITFIQ